MSRSAAPSLSLLASALLAAVATSGCGSLALGKGQFSCQGHPSHPLCLPTSKVYALTESSEPIQSNAQAPEPEPEPQGRMPFRSDMTAPSDAEPTSLDLFTGEAKPPSRKPVSPGPDLESPPRLADAPPPLSEVADADLLLPRSTDPLPLRQPAQVMRIWLAPWEDDRGDLHASGYVFTEIASRTWTLADGPARFSNAVLRPLQVAERRPASGESSKPGARASTRSAPEKDPGPADRMPHTNLTPRSQP